MANPETASKLITRYFQACNDADRQALLDCFTTDATHYFPPGLPDTPWRSAEKIADNWVRCVKTLGSRWTIDHMLVSADGHEAVIEWTHWKTKTDQVLRGDEWYLFNDDITRIREVRAYYAAPADPQRQINKLQGYEYAQRGYAMEAPSAPPKIA